jgi:hypothetical protein
MRHDRNECTGSCRARAQAPDLSLIFKPGGSHFEGCARGDDVGDCVIEVWQDKFAGYGL